MAPTNSSASSELKNILDAAGTMIITTDLAGIVRIFNPASERLLGWSAREVVGRHTPALWHDPAEITARAAELSQELGRAVSPGFEVFVAQALRQLNEPRQWTFIRKDGSRFPVQLVVSVIRDAAGTVTGYLGTAQDLTALVEAEQERDRFFSVSLDMLGVANTDGYFRRINPTFSRVLGWTDKEFLSRPFLEFVHPADQAATLREIEKLAAGTPTLHFENRYRCKDGSWRWVAWTCTTQSDGTLFAAGRDVSVLKQAEEELRQTQQDLAITLNSIGDAVMATDAARRITRMNPVAEQLTGWTQSEAVGQSIEEVFRIIHEETRRPAIIPVDDVLATGIVHGLANHTVLISRDGTERPIADSAAPIRDDAGQITGVVLVFRDVAAERQFERELQQLNADLERRIDERTRTLAESERRLRNDSHILETLSSDASLEQTLDVIALCVETEDPSALCSILVLDESGKHLLHGAAPSLPDFYNQAIHGLEIGESVGSCGTAAATKRRVIADDIQTHPNWANFLSLADKAGLRSCWSEPILADAGQVLGTFAIYHREPRTPNERDLERIQWAASFVRLVIERKQAQAKLVENERFNRATLDSLSAHVAVLDATGKIVATNQTWRNFAQANGTAWQFVAEGTDYLAICNRAAANGNADALAVAEAIRQTISGERETWFHEYPCHASDEQRWFYCRVTRFPENGAVHVVVAHENITAMKLAQEQLAVARAQFETLAHVSPVAIMFLDKTGNCVDVNDRWSEMSGFGRQDALGDNWLAAVHPDDRPRVSHAWSEAVRVVGKFESEYRFLHPDGKVVWLVSQGVPIRDANGRVSGFIRVATDLTEQKRTEQALRLLSTDLALLRGAALYESVVRQLAELLKCEFAFICCHDPAEPEQFDTLAFFADGEIQSNFRYPAANTPCEYVVDRNSCIISKGVREKFAQDIFLLDHQIESYVGVPFIDNRGRQIGHLGVMSREPLTNPENIEAIAKLFAASVVAEMERQTTERRYSDLFESSADAIVITNHEGIVVQANRKVTAIFGWTPADLVGQPYEVLISPKQRAGHASLREYYVQTAVPWAMESGRNDLFGLRKDGSRFPLDISLSPIKTQEGLLVAAAMRDVSERTKAEEELMEANAFASTVIENVSGLFYVLDQNGDFIRWNQSLEELLGLTSAEMRRTNAVSMVHEDDRERMAGRMAEVFIEGHAVDEARLLHKDGVRHFLLSGRKLEMNGVVYLVGSGAEITERKQAENEIQLLNQTLEQRVRDRTAQLTYASQAKSEFLATMSHELRTPLNGILGMNELLLTTELSQRQRKYVEACNSSGKLLMQLINDILDLSKIESGKLELDPRECSLEAFTFDVVDIMSHAVRTKQIVLNCRITPEACVVGWFDDTRLRQVLVNLVSNAVKFTASGSIIIAVDLVAQVDRTARLRFAVSDTGMGIPHERLDRLFMTFSQVDSSTTRFFGGTGLGLSICKQLIELMGGEIGVESQVGVGTTFWFELEIVTSDRVSTTEQGKRLLAGTPIIAIDGLDRERSQVAECLGSWGCPLQQVATVNEALAAVRAAAAAGDPVRIILADCRLVAGDEFLQLQKLAAEPNVHVIALGTPPDELSRNHLYGLGVQHVLEDPIRPSVLFETLTQVLSVRKGAAPIETDRPPLPPQLEAKLSGHILVAEDNRINQLYITELLKHFGCTSDLVVNGEEALTAVQKQRYDLVLMDCQMPEMDGFSAALEIRKREAAGQYSERLPIVALTANALKGDRERCLEAGMDEYISKPVEGNQLKAVLAKYLSWTSSQRDTTGRES